MEERDEQWEYLSKQLFSTPSKVPVFLWTRVLAGIEAEEQRRAQSWWMQWPWMSRLTATVALFVFIGAGVVFYQSAGGISLESVLQGETNPQTAMHWSSTHEPTTQEVTAWALGGGKSWEDD